MHGKRKRENGRLGSTTQQALSSPFSAQAEGEGVSDSEGRERSPPPSKAVKVMGERGDQPMADAEAGVDDVSSGAEEAASGGGRPQRAEELTPEAAVHAAQPPGTATPKDSRLLPTEPQTGASAALLGQPPAGGPGADDGAEGGLQGLDREGASLLEAVGKLAAPGAAASVGACGEGAREEHAKLLASLAQ